MVKHSVYIERGLTNNVTGNNGAEVAATAGSWRTEGMNGGVELDSMQPSVVSGSFGNRGIGGRLRFG